MDYRVIRAKLLASPHKEILAPEIEKIEYPPVSDDDYEWIDRESLVPFEYFWAIAYQDRMTVCNYPTHMPDYYPWFGEISTRMPLEEIKARMDGWVYEDVDYSDPLTKWSLRRSKNKENQAKETYIKFKQGEYDAYKKEVQLYNKIMGDL